MIAIKPMKLVSLFLAGLLLAGCEKATPPSAPRPVKATRVGDISAFASRIFPGRSEATQEVSLAFRVSGPLIEFPVVVGQSVKKGQLLARIDPRDFRINVRKIQGALAEAAATLRAMKAGARPEDIKAAEAQLAAAEAASKLAQSEYDRTKEALSKGAATQLELERAAAVRDRATATVTEVRENLLAARTGAREEDVEAMEAKIKALEASLDAVKAALDDTSLTAPFAGSISAKYVDNFQTVLAQQPIVKLQDASRIEVTVDVPEDLITKVRYIKKIVCTFEALPGRSVEAHIKEVGTEASMQTRTYPVTLIADQPENAQILPGMSAEVQVTAQLPSDAETTGFEIPASAVFSDGGQSRFVWVVDEKSQTAFRREVVVGNLGSHGIMVMKGLKAGEWVVTAGVHRLREGQNVRILSQGSHAENGGH